MFNLLLSCLCFASFQNRVPTHFSAVILTRVQIPYCKRKLSHVLSLMSVTPVCLMTFLSFLKHTPEDSPYRVKAASKPEPGKDRISVGMTEHSLHPTACLVVRWVLPSRDV